MGARARALCATSGAEQRAICIVVREGAGRLADLRIYVNICRRAAVLVHTSNSPRPRRAVLCCVVLGVGRGSRPPAVRADVKFLGRGDVANGEWRIGGVVVCGAGTTCDDYSIKGRRRAGRVDWVGRGWGWVWGWGVLGTSASTSLTATRRVQQPAIHPPRPSLKRSHSVLCTSVYLQSYHSRPLRSLASGLRS